MPGKLFCLRRSALLPEIAQETQTNLGWNQTPGLNPKGSTWPGWGTQGVFPSQAHPWDSSGAHGFSCDSWVTTGAQYCLAAIPFRMYCWIHKHSLLPRPEPNIFPVGYSSLWIFGRLSCFGMRGEVQGQPSHHSQKYPFLNKTWASKHFLMEPLIFMVDKWNPASFPVLTLQQGSRTKTFYLYIFSFHIL